MARRNTKAKAFSQFTRLPPEIRRMIWLYCLPRRVIETNHPGSLAHQIYEECYSEDSFRRSIQRPILASVCREAAAITASVGFAVPAARMTGLSTWVQPGFDWVQSWNFPKQLPFRQSETVHGYLQQTDITYSTVMGPIVPFSLNSETDWPSLTLYAFPKGWHSDIMRPKDINQESNPIFLFAIPIHVTEKAIRDSGLFGLLGDARVQLVDVGDTRRLLRFRQFVKRSARKLAKSELLPIFEQILETDAFQAKVKRWQEKVEWRHIAETWAFERSSRDSFSDGISLDVFYSAWSPKYVAGESWKFRMERYRLVESNPWVIQTRSKMLKLEPKIMLRACTDKQCAVNRTRARLQHAYRQEW